MRYQEWTVFPQCDSSEAGQECDQGLRKGVGYGITGVLDVDVPRMLRQTLQRESLKLVRLRGGQAWRGAWSDEWVDAHDDVTLYLCDWEN